jgi:hypothetical protein
MTQVIQFKKAAAYAGGQETAAQTLWKFAWHLAPVLLLSLAVHFFFFGDYYYTFDDSYVFHVYARNLAQGAGFSFNPGQTSHAATPLLTFVLAAQHLLFGDRALLTAKIVNLVFSLWATLLLFVISYRITSSTIVAVGSCVVWSASPLESILCSGPQDFTLFAFLILLSLHWYLFHPKSLWTYVFLGLVVLTRYEGALYGGLLFLNHLYIDIKNREVEWKQTALRLVLMAALPAVWFFYIGTHATLLPTSGSAKLNPWALREIPHFLMGMIIFFFPPLLFAAVTSALSQAREKAPHLMFLFLWVSFCLFFYGPFLDNRRYYVHLLPFLGLFSLAYLKHVSERAFRSPRPAQIFLTVVAGISFAATLFTIPYYYQQTRGQKRFNTYGAYKEAGLWIKQNTPQNATFASEEIGVIPYFAERRLVDFSGWLDLASKKFREREDGMNPQMLEYLSSRRPDYIIINTDFVSQPRQQMLSADPRFTLAHQSPLLEHDSLLIYACHW